MKAYAPQRWVGTATQIAGAIILASRIAPPVVAYPIMLVGSLLWLFVAIRRDDRALALMMGAYSAINLIGIAAWGLAR